MGRRAVVYLAALAAFLMRFPRLLWPLRADVAGLLLVARAWTNGSNSLYGTYWVDRPPVLLTLVKATDAVGGPELLRVVAALGMAAMVFAAADAARTLARLHGRDDGDRLAGWAAVASAALGGTASIEAVAAKSEVLAVPLVMASFAASLRALERRSAGWALAAGLAGALALGMKQNIIGGLAFGGVLLVGALVQRRITAGQFARLAGGALVGAAVPVLACVVWAAVWGPGVRELWYEVYGFRSDSVSVLVDQPSEAPMRRARHLMLTFVSTGMVAVLVWYVVRFLRVFRLDASVAVATAVTLMIDGVGLALGGSYWQAYLLVLVPDLVLALVLVRAAARGWVPRVVLAWVAVSTAISLVVWSWNFAVGTYPPTEVNTGVAVREAAEPGDDVVVFGGRADVVETTGMSSPYRHLWSLPMRVLDPDFAELRGLVDSDRAPVWVIEWVSFYDWDNEGADALARSVKEHYVLVGEACSGHGIWLRKDLQGERPDVVPDCEQAYRPSWWP